MSKGFISGWRKGSEETTEQGPETVLCLSDRGRREGTPGESAAS